MSSFIFSINDRTWCYVKWTPVSRSNVVRLIRPGRITLSSHPEVRTGLCRHLVVGYRSVSPWLKTVPYDYACLRRNRRSWRGDGPLYCQLETKVYCSWPIFEFCLPLESFLIKQMVVLQGRNSRLYPHWKWKGIDRTFLRLMSVDNSIEVESLIREKNKNHCSFQIIKWDEEQYQIFTLFE